MSEQATVQTTKISLKGLFSGLKVDPFGSCFGMLGATLLALSSDISPWGWVAFLVSNTLWICSGIKSKNWSLVVQYLYFTGTGVLGVYTSFFS